MVSPGPSSARTAVAGASTNSQRDRSPRPLLSGVFAKTLTARLPRSTRSLALNPSFAWGWHVSGLLRRKRCESTVADRRLTGQDASGVQAQGSNSPRRRLGQLLTSLVSTSVRYAWGLMPCSLHVSISEASIAQFSAPSS